MRWLDVITDSMDMGLSNFQELVKVTEACCDAVQGVAKSQIWLGDWKTNLQRKEEEKLKRIKSAKALRFRRECFERPCLSQTDEKRACSLASSQLEFVQVDWWKNKRDLEILKFRSIIGQWKWNESRSVVSDSLWPCGLYSPWNSPGQYTEVGSLSLLQQIFPTQG